MVIRNKEVHKIWKFETGYETIQYCDGSSSCNCVPWRRRKTCRHTRMIAQDIIDLCSVSCNSYAPLKEPEFIEEDASLVGLPLVDMRGLPTGAPSLPSQPVTPSTDPKPKLSSRKFNFNLA